MQWLELTIETASRGIDMLAARLTALGFDSFIMDDEQEFHEFLEENRPCWGYVDDELEAAMAGRSQIRLYIENSTGAPERVARLQTELAAFRTEFPDAGLGSLTVSYRALEESDWENGWKQYYRPIPVGDRLLVTPEWQHPENPDGRLLIRLDPGVMFGTGDHASTKLCLTAMERTIRGGERVLDLGCGSGILSIAALRLGGKTVLGVDIDPKGEDIARENAGYNDYGAPAFRAVTGNVLDLTVSEPFDVVLANIVADVILPLTPMISRYLRPGGVFLCSGILEARLGEIKSALKRAGMTELWTKTLDGWAMCRAILPASEAMV